MRLLRRVLLLALLLAAGLVAFVGWRLWSVPPRALVADAAARLAAAGIAVRIDGEPEPVLWPWPGLRVGGVQGAGAGAAVRLSAARARLGVSLPDLLRGRLALGRVSLDDAVLELEHPILPRPLALTGAELVVSTGPGGDLSLAGDGKFAGRPLTLVAVIADPAALAGGRPSAVTVELSSQGDRVRFAGDVALVPSLPLPVLDGTVTAVLADPQGTLLWLTGPEPGGGLAGVAGLKALDFEADLDAAPGRLLLRGRGSADLGGRALGMAATLRGAEDWMLTGEGSAELTVRSGGLFSAYWQGAFGPDAADGWRVSGPVTAAILDLDALRAWSAHYLPGLPDGNSARLLGQLAVSRDGLLVTGLELRRDGAEPLLGSIALNLATGAVDGDLGADPPAVPPHGTDVVPGASVPPAKSGAAGPTGEAADPPPPADGRRDAADEHREPPPLDTAAPGTTGGGSIPEDASFSAPAALPDASGSSPVTGRIGTFRMAPAPLPAAEAPGAPGGGRADPAENLRGAPLPPGSPPSPLPVRRDPMAAPAPQPRAAAPALAPADIDP